MENKDHRWQDFAQTLAAYVAIPASLVYPVGLIALFVQFIKYYNLDFSTAWYAASLVNRMVAIGQGVTILALALVGSVLASALFAKLIVAVTSPEGKRKVWLIAMIMVLSLLTLGAYIAYSRIVAGGRLSWFVIRGRLSSECNLDKALRHQLNIWPDSLVPAFIFLAGCLVGGLLIYISLRDQGRVSSVRRDGLRPRLSFYIRGVTEGWMRSGLAAAYLGCVIASILLALFTPVFMPAMTFGGTLESQREKDHVKESSNNTFLSHTDGQWYFLHRIDDEKQSDPDKWRFPDYRIISLAEGQVDFVRVKPNAPRASRVAPLPLGFAWPPLELSKNHCKSKNDN